MLFSLLRWFDRCEDPAAAGLKSPTNILAPTVVNAAVRALLLEPRVRELLWRWWAEEIQPQAPAEHRALLDEVFRFDMATLPLIASQVDPADLVEEGGGFYLRRSEPFDLDVPALVVALRADPPVEVPPPAPTMFELSWRLGLEAYIDSHEISVQYMGQIVRSEQLEALPAAG